MPPACSPMSDAARRPRAATRSRPVNPCKTKRGGRADMRGSDGASGHAWGSGSSDIGRRRPTRGRADVCSSGPAALMHASKAGRDRRRAGRRTDAAGAVAIRAADRRADNRRAPAIAAWIVAWAVRAVLIPTLASLHCFQWRQVSERGASQAACSADSCHSVGDMKAKGEPQRGESAQSRTRHGSSFLKKNRRRRYRRR
jgi:hypothetical protein